MNVQSNEEVGLGGISDLASPLSRPSTPYMYVHRTIYKIALI